MDAIERAFELAAPFLSASITIHLFSGNHFCVRTARDFYVPILVDRNSQNLDLTIQPLYCSDSVTLSSNCSQ